MTKVDLQCGKINQGDNNLEYGVIGHSHLLTERIADVLEIVTIFKTAGTLSKFGVQLWLNTYDEDATFTLQKAGIDVNQTFSVTSSTTGFFEDPSNTDAVVADDKFRLEADGTVATVGDMEGFPKIVYEPTSGQDCISKGIVSFGNTVGDRFAHLFASWNTTESVVQTRLTFPSTFRNLFANVYLNTRTTTTDYKTHINGGDGNLIVSVATVTTGEFEDTSNTDDLGVTDTITWKADLVSGSGGISANMSYEIVSPTYAIQSSRATGTNSSGETNYQGLVGSDILAVEAEKQQAWKAQTFDALEIRSRLNSTNFAVTCTFRKDGADGNQVIVIAAGTTGYFGDTTNSDTITDDQAVNVKYVSGTGTGTLTMSALGCRSTKKQIARPDGDSAIGAWTDDVGGTTNIYQEIDEIVPDDTDFIHSEAIPVNSKYVATLSNVTDPNTSDDHVVRYRYRRNDSFNVIDIIVRLKQGASTVIASKTHAGVTTTFVDGEFLLSGAEADNITDYNDLRIEFEADVP